MTTFALMKKNAVFGSAGQYYLIMKISYFNLKPIKTYGHFDRFITIAKLRFAIVTIGS